MDVIQGFLKQQTPNQKQTSTVAIMITAIIESESPTVNRPTS
jgi:hypothetical protein